MTSDDQPNAQRTPVDAEQAPDTARNSNDGSQKHRRDIWEKIEILSKPLGSLVTALIVAMVGYFGQSTLTELASEEQDARLYTELLSRREEAGSALRKDMFGHIMSDFFDDYSQAEPGQVPSTMAVGDGKQSGLQLLSASVDAGPSVDTAAIVKNRISKKLLKLEMLALNFGDSMSLGPLFSETAKDIRYELKVAKVQDRKFEAAPFYKRLNGLAKRVSSSQAAVIKANGAYFDVQTWFPADHSADRLTRAWEFSWPDPSKHQASEHRLELDTIERDVSLSLSRPDFNNKTVDVVLDIIEYVKLTRDNAECQMALDNPRKLEECEAQGEGAATDSESNADAQVCKQDVKILATIKLTPNDDKPCTKVISVVEEFTLNYFNFPLIDNTRLSNNHRLALILSDFDRHGIQVLGLVFPGLYASQRDKPFLNEAIQQLNRQKAEMVEEESRWDLL